MTYNVFGGTLSLTQSFNTYLLRNRTRSTRKKCKAAAIIIIGIIIICIIDSSSSVCGPACLPAGHCKSLCNRLK